MPLVNFSNVDFDQIKEQIKDYLRANSNFTDYDFEGSNLSTIIDTLAYNTYINSYNANMVTNEVFLDSATLRENVVSLARTIGYVPRSRKSAVANISFTVDASNLDAVSLTLKAGIVAISTKQFGNKTYTFSIPNDITEPVQSTGLVVFDGIEVYEGTYITQNFTVSSTNPNQRFILQNPGIDTSLLRVIVKESQSSSVQDNFYLYSSVYNVGPTTPAYYIAEVEGERYELFFGDGVFGKKLQSPNYIEARYITASGEEANGISNFTFSGQLRDNDDNIVTSGVSIISTNSASYGGSSIESVDSVKKFAPQIYASQNRAVTAQDYEAIIPQIYPEAESVSAFGGEDLNPPAYGKVFISVKPINGVFVSSTVKQNLRRELKKYSVAGIIPEIIDLKYLYVETDSYVYYNTNLATSASQIATTVTNNLVDYANSQQLNKFGARFKYSKYQKVVDDSGAAITSNITTVNMRRDLEARLNTFAEYEVCFGNQFYLKNHGHSPVADGKVIGYNIKSSGFTVSGISGTVYLGDNPNADQETGTLFLFKLNSPTEPVIVKRNIGSIDYVKGEIKLNPIKILATTVYRDTNLIEIQATPLSNDVIGLQDLYLQLDISNVNISMVPDQIASGDDISGSNYIVRSSYSDGGLVRGPVVTIVSDNGDSGSEAEQVTIIAANDQVVNSSNQTTLRDGARTLRTRTISRGNQSSSSSSYSY